jgi:hypothetical protein
MTDSVLNLDLVDQVFERIPEWTWTTVRDAIVANLVDNMPGAVVERLTGTYDNFDLAEKILIDYYTPTNKYKDLIVDSFKIIGDENTLYLLDSLQLDKIPEPTED